MAGKKNGKKSENDKETKVTIDYDVSKGGFQFDAGELQQALHNGAVVKEEQVTHERADSRDVLVGKHWEELPHEARIATGSIRRKAHLLHQRPDLCFEDLRGNIETRLKKAEHYDAIVMAKAALDRLGLTPEVVDVLDPSILLPQVGQGALAIETRAQDENLKAIFSEIDHVDTHRAVLAERAFLHELGSGCDLPVAANAVVSGDDISLTAAVSSIDGKSLLRTTETGQESLSLGKSVAQNLLDTQGGRELLKKQ